MSSKSSTVKLLTIDLACLVQYVSVLESCSATLPHVNLQSPLQAPLPGPVAEGQEGVAAWSDSEPSVSDAWHNQAFQPGPVCEGYETNSDAWSDSAASESAATQAADPAVAAGSQPARQSRFGKLLGRTKGAASSSAAAASAEPQQAGTILVSEQEDDLQGTSQPEATAAAPKRTGMRSKLFGKARRRTDEAQVSDPPVDELSLVHEEGLANDMQTADKISTEGLEQSAVEPSDSVAAEGSGPAAVDASSIPAVSGHKGMRAVLFGKGRRKASLTSLAASYAEPIQQETFVETDFEEADIDKTGGEPTAAASKQAGVRSMLFGRKRRKASATSLPDVQPTGSGQFAADTPEYTEDDTFNPAADSELATDSQDAVPSAPVTTGKGMRAKLFSRKRGHSTALPMPKQDFDVAAGSQGVLDAVAEGFALPERAAEEPVAAQSQVASVPMSDLSWYSGNRLRGYEGISEPLQAQAIAAAGAAVNPEEADVDPLSADFEDRIASPKPQATLQQRNVTLTPHGVSRPEPELRTPSYSDFDPLTATLEEFQEYNRSQEKERAQSPDMSPAVNPQEAATMPAATTAQQPRKARAIPKVFRLRKAAPANSAAAVEAQTDSPIAANTDPSMLPTVHEQASATDSQSSAVPKPHKGPFHLLKKRNKDTAAATASAVDQQQQQPLDAVDESQANPMPAHEAGNMQGLGTTHDQKLTDEGLDQGPHMTTTLGLSAGLSSTFGSFMAASPQASPRAAASPSFMPVPHVTQQSYADQVHILLLAHAP